KTNLTFAAVELPSWLQFDGDDTITGTPRPGDEGEHQVHVRVAEGDSTDAQRFSIVVSPANASAEADLAVAATVAPNPAAVDASVTWTFTASNDGAAYVANFVLDTIISDTEFRIDSLS